VIRRAATLAGALALVLGAAACSLFESKPAGTAAVAADEGAKPRGPLEREADALLAVDRAFARRSLEAGAPEAFRQYFDAGGVQLGASGAPAVGPEQVRARLAQAAGGILSWEPRFAEVFADGAWGWTWGDWQLHEPGAGGRRLGQGRYVNLWRKQPDGSWKVRLDHGSVEPQAR
jgi:ketosteroid isomerase-like protein